LKPTSHLGWAARGAGLADLTPVAAEAGAAEGDPRPVYTWAGPPGTEPRTRSYPPSGGGAPRLVAEVGVSHTSRRLAVWDTGTGAFLGALPCPAKVVSLVTYQRSSDGRPRIAAGSDKGHLTVWDGDDLALAHHIVVGANGQPVRCLAVYGEPISGSTRLVTG
jgi:WD40 repeat protein